jgi:alkylation response protein AidB-like acyl-CoA dehydrogenase
MDVDDTPEELALRAEARAWLDANAEPLPIAGGIEELRTHRAHDEAADEALVEENRAWQRRKAAGGWVGAHWPVEHGGRGLSPLLARCFAEEEARYDVPGNMFTVGVDMVGPTLIEWGTPDQRERWLPRILRAEDIWCQLFSEPGAGSDLAGLATRAVPDGDEWVVSGQKVWTTHAHFADLGFLLARTDPDVPKYRGITAIAVDMRAPGVEVRPLRQMDGAIHFNEVFLDEVRVPRSNTVGPEGGGWGVAMTMLTHERASIGGSAMYTAGHVAELARKLGRAGDPTVRQRLADLYTRGRLLEFLGYRLRTAAAAGRPPGPEASVMKLLVSSYYERGGDLIVELQGPAGMLSRGDAPYDGRFGDLFMAQWAPRIGGGTDQVQRNIVGERVLGLPGELRVDRDVPFRDLPRS